MKKLSTVDFVTIALIAAILCILAPISITIGFTPIPITLGLFAVAIAGIILGSIKGSICVFVYIMLGAVGLPVFSGYIGGIQKVMGPTGGYIFGYLFLAFILGYFTERFEGKWYMSLLGALAGTVVCYAFGTLWMGIWLSMTPAEALWAGVIPSLPLDVIKLFIAVFAACPVRGILIRQNLLSTKSDKN